MTVPAIAYPDKNHAKNVLEWTVFAISCLLVLTTLVILIMDTPHSSRTPALIAVQAGPAYSEKGLTWIPIEIVNSGGKAAESVQVEARRPSTGEATTITIDHLPRGATKSGQVSFPGSDAAIAVEVRVASYQEP